MRAGTALGLRSSHPTKALREKTWAKFKVKMTARSTCDKSILNATGILWCVNEASSGHACRNPVTRAATLSLVIAILPSSIVPITIDF